MKRARIALGRLVALTFDGADVQQHRAVELRRGLQRIDERVVVVAVNRPDVAKAQLFEDHRRLLRRPDEVHRADLGAFDRLLRRAAERNALEHILAGSANEVRKRLAAQHREIRRDRADVRRDRHLVVVEDHHELALERARVVERLVGEAAGQRAVAQDRDDLLLAADEIARRRHAERRGDRGAGVARAERIVRRLAAHRKTGKTAALAMRPEAVAPPGKDLVHVGLMADVPDELIGGKIEHSVKRERQLDDAEIRRQMAAVDGARADEQVANLTCQDVDFFTPEALDVGRRVDALDNHWPRYTHRSADALRARHDARGERRRARRLAREPQSLRPVPWFEHRAKRRSPIAARARAAACRARHERLRRARRSIRPVSISTPA